MPSNSSWVMPQDSASATTHNSWRISAWIRDWGNGATGADGCADESDKTISARCVEVLSTKTTILHAELVNFLITEILSNRERRSAIVTNKCHL
jgi:hypothetical protein